MAKLQRKPGAPEDVAVPSTHNWRTSDADEVNRRRLRARSESFRISNREPQFPIFSE